MMPELIQRALTSIGRETGRIVLHSPCVACGEELPWRRRVGSACLDCWSSAMPVSGVRCRRCGLPWDADEPLDSWTCGECSRGKSALDWRDAWGWYRGTLQKLLHAFKFDGHDFLAPPLAGHLDDVVTSRDRDFDVLVAVPLHRKRLRERGYNQAELLSRHLARSIGIPGKSWLARPVETRAQSTLPREDRAGNVRRAFVADRRVRGASVLLVDDVMTTGATLEASARALREAGARRVCAVTVARA